MKKVKTSLPLPELIFIFAILSVFISMLIFYLVDLRNVFGLRDMMFGLSGDYFFFSYRPFFFHHWGRNGGLAEIVQWFMLAGSGLLAALTAGIVKLKNRRLYKFWLILSIGFILMLLEDAGDIRHTIMGYIQALFDEPDQGIMGSLTELILFSILAFIPLYALINYWQDIKIYSKTKIYLLIGFAFYGLAGLSSFLGTALEGLLSKNLYMLLGEKFYQLALFLGDSQLKNQWESWQADGWFSIEFFLMDSMFEENIEIIAAGALLAATVSFLILALDKDKFKINSN